MLCYLFYFVIIHARYLYLYTSTDPLVFFVRVGSVYSFLILGFSFYIR